MEPLTLKQYLEKSGQILEKYRANMYNLTRQRNSIEARFFMPNEMVDYFYANKSEYKAWKQVQDMIITLEDAYAELVASMMEAMTYPDDYEYYLKDKRITVMELKEEEREDVPIDESLEDIIKSDE